MEDWNDEASRVRAAVLTELIAAVSNGDNRQRDALIGSQCAALGGFEFSVIERGILRSKVRVYVGDKSIVMWTVSEAVRDAE